VSGPRIICFDLETGPDLLGEVLECWPQLSNYPGQTFKGQVQSVLCFGWKVFGVHEKEAQSICAWDFPTWQKDVNDDREIVSAAKEILESADVLVTQNGRRFDFPVLQTRLRKWKIGELDPKIPHDDTKLILKGNYSLISNSLNNAGRFFLENMKMDHEGWKLWVKTMRRDMEAAEVMRAYNIQDVVLLEQLYREIKHMSRSGVNHNLFNLERKDCCPKCGSTRMRSDGWRRTQTMTYQRLFCMGCGYRPRTDAAGRNPR
jgi:hypothetical protein